MPRIDFHLLDDSDPLRRLHYCCRLAAKAWRSGLRIHIQCEDAQECQQLDQLLWEHPASSFIPHQASGSTGTAPVLLSWEPDASGEQELLINLSRRVPGFAGRFERIIEVVNQDPTIRQALRHSFAWYREQGYSPQTIPISHDMRQ